MIRFGVGWLLVMLASWVWARVRPERAAQDFRDPFDLVHGELGVHRDGEIALEEVRRDRARLLRLVHRL